MRDLNSVRNDFIHFKPMTVGMLLTRFPAMTETGLHIITFLLNESNNILWAGGSDRFGLRTRSQKLPSTGPSSLADLHQHQVRRFRPA